MSIRTEEGPFREILIKSGKTTAMVAPERGGIVTSFQVNGNEVLFLDRSTFDNPKKNVRGGIPLLFPNAGPLKGEPFILDQHGFARKMPWVLTEQAEDSVVMTLLANDQTKAVYPYDFRLDLRVRVASVGRLIHGMTITNTGNKPMPTAYGAHPYFLINADKKPQISTNINGFNPSEVGWGDEYDTLFKNSGSVEINVPASMDSLSRRLRITSNRPSSRFYMSGVCRETFFV